MGRIKIDDLPEDQKVSKEEMKKILGGIILTSFPTYPTFYNPIGRSGFNQIPISLTGKIQGITGAPGDFSG